MRTHTYAQTHTEYPQDFVAVLNEAEAPDHPPLPGMTYAGERCLISRA